MAPELAGKRRAQETALAFGIRLQSLEVRGPGEIDHAFAAIARERAGAVIVLADPMLIDQRTRIADLAARRRLPTMSGQIDYAEAGGPMTYGPSLSDMFRRAATYVDEILKGAKPADLPIEQPMKFERIVSMKTAKAPGLMIPQSLLVRTEQIIQCAGARLLAAGRGESSGPKRREIDCQVAERRQRGWLVRHANYEAVFSFG